MVEFDQMWFIFQHNLPCAPHTSSIGVAGLGFSWYRSFHPDPRKRAQLQVWPHHRSDTASQPGVFFFFMLGNRKKSDGAESGEYGGWSTSSSHSHGQQPLQPQTCVQEHCPGETRLPFISFPGRFEMSLVLLQSPVLLIKCGFIWKKTNAVSIRKGWI